MCMRIVLSAYYIWYIWTSEYTRPLMTVLKNKVDLILCNALRSIYSRVGKNIVSENWYHFSIKTTVIINNIRLIFRFDPNSKSVMPNMNYIFNIQAISIFVFLFIFGRRNHIEIWHINIHSSLHPYFEVFLRYLRI